MSQFKPVNIFTQRPATDTRTGNNRGLLHTCTIHAENIGMIFGELLPFLLVR
jgi:hypothetical protein